MAAKNARYENAALFGAADLLRNGWHLGNPLRENMVTEIGLIHARALDDFLGRRNRGAADDVIAMDFNSSWKPRRILSAKDRTDINKRLAHITTARAVQRSWRITEYADRAGIELSRFVESLEPTRARWFTHPILDDRL